MTEYFVNSDGSGFDPERRDLMVQIAVLDGSFGRWTNDIAGLLDGQIYAFTIDGDFIEIQELKDIIDVD